MTACDIRIGTVEADLATGWLVYSHQIPEPAVMTYKDHSAQLPRHDGGVAQRGYVSVILQWDVLTYHQLHRLWKVVDDAVASTDQMMYATVAKGWNGSAPGQSWIDVKGFPSRPQVSPVGGSQAKTFENVVLTINNLTTVNDPASF